MKFKALFKSSINTTYDAHKVVFLRGFQRSGTNWLSNLLNLHDDITSTGEFHFAQLFKAQENYKKRQFSVFKSTEDIVLIDRAFHHYIRSLIIEKCNFNKVCVDRTPCPIKKTYVSDISHIMITRDGRDCAVSWMYHCLRRGLNLNNGKLKKYKELFDNDNQYFELNKNLLLQSPVFLKKIARQWNDHVLSDMAYYQDIKNGKREGDIFWVKYEELLNSTNSIRRDIYRHLGLDQDKSSRLDNLTKPGFDEHNPTSHYRKGEAGRWKEYFTDEQHDWFLSQAEEALTKLDYI